MGAARVGLSTLRALGRQPAPRVLLLKWPKHGAPGLPGVDRFLRLESVPDAPVSRANNKPAAAKFRPSPAPGGAPVPGLPDSRAWDARRAGSAAPGPELSA